MSQQKTAVTAETESARLARLLEQQLGARPGDYQSQWQSQLEDILRQIAGRERFSYDPGADPVYRQARAQYQNQGRLAMADTMGQAAALTGGYGNSYAVTAGQQAYQGQLQGLTEMLPQLYQLALDRYRQQGEDLQSQYSRLRDQEDRNYSRYRDSVNQWQADTDLLQSQRELAYRQETDARDFDYQKHRDETSDSQWQKEFDLAVKKLKR